MRFTKDLVTGQVCISSCVAYSSLVFFVYHFFMFAEDTYFLDLYMFSTMALMITSIVQCWLTDKAKIKKIIWTTVIVLTFPVFISGTLAFSLIHYRAWRKVIPFIIVVLLAMGTYFQLMGWVEKESGMAASGRHFEEQMSGIDSNAVLIEENSALYEWVETASLKMLNLSNDDYERQLESNKSLFTKHGYSSYYKALERARIIEGLSKKDLDTVFVANNNAIKAYVIANQGKDEWIKESADWIVNVPGSMMYKHIKKPNAMNVTVSVIVKKRANGFEATQLIVRPE